MSNAQAERAISQLYESDSLRSELRDEEASLLLMWGEARLKELANHDLPDGQFDHLSEKFRTLLAAINICVGKRKTSPSQHLPMMASISSAAEAAGYAFAPDDQTTFLKEQAVLTNQDAISELLGLLKAGEIPPPPSQNIGEAVAEMVVPQPTPMVVQSTLPPQPENMPMPTIAVSTPSLPGMGEAVAETIAQEPSPVVVGSNQLPQAEDMPEPQPPSQNMSAVPAENVAPQPAPMENTQPPQLEAIPESQPPAPSMSESIAATVAPEPSSTIVEGSQPPQPQALPEPNPSPTVVESMQPPQPEDLPEPQPPAQSMGEAITEIITPQPPAVVESSQPPQPEDLPEFPQQPPPLESYDED